MKNFGKELIIDLHECNSEKFTRHHINEFFKGLCKEIDMVACKQAWWDYTNDAEAYNKAPDHLKGTSAVQFIMTSNITIHTLDVTKNVYLNIFSCKDFSDIDAMVFSIEFFEGKMVKYLTITRL